MNKVLSMDIWLVGSGTAEITIAAPAIRLVAQLRGVFRKNDILSPIEG